MIVILALAVGYVLTHSKPSALLDPSRDGVERIYVDAADLLFAFTVIGLFAIALVGVAGWAISRRSVTPLATALRVQRDFVADASHELRTPLTVLDARLQLLQRRLERGDDWRATATDLRTDVRSMIDLVTDLLLVAEQSATALRAGSSVGCELAPVVREAVSDLAVLAESRGVSVTVRVGDEGARVPVPEAGLRRCLVLLLDNAIAHSSSGGAVRIDAARSRRRMVIRVSDTGSGITGIAPEDVFERFARGTPVEGDAPRRGFGIGLALVRDFTTRFGGVVLVESTGARGTVIRLELPTERAGRRSRWQPDHAIGGAPAPKGTGWSSPGSGHDEGVVTRHG